MKRLTCAVALALLAAVAIDTAHHRCAQPQRRIAEVRPVRARLIHTQFVRPAVPRPVERAIPSPEPSPRHRKFPAWFLRRHIATLLPTTA